MSGSIPTEIGDLANLAVLNLGGNSLSGSIPTEIGDLANLTRLYLGGNSLSGSIPTQIGDLTELKTLVLGDNSLSGPIPTQIGSLTNLGGLNLGANSLSGSIPTEIGSLINLTGLNLRGNSLSGAIPDEIGSLTNLVTLDLSRNSLSGVIPTEFGGLANLKRLQLHDNSLSGSIPSQIGSLTNLIEFNLSRNSLSGSIPAEIGDLTNLTRLDLRDNSLSGSIPAEIGDLTNLTYLDLRDNSLSGSIPAEIGSLTSLIGLYLRDNSLSGVIPTEFGDITNLIHLDLSDNSLWGAIPAEIGSLANLTWLYLSNNDLSGCVPAALSSVHAIAFDAGLPYCAPARLSVTAARAGESDGAVVFTVTVTPPVTGSDPPAAAPEISVSYTTTAGTAAAGVDYTTTSGTLTIAAGARYGTVSVPVVDDAVTERTETFTLSLSRPVGAELANSNARGWIHDTPQRRFPSTACAGAVVRGDIAGVFDIEQTRYSDWHHVFVDVHLTCGTDLTSAVGYPTAVKVIAGPTDSITASRYCLVETGTTQTTAAVSTAAGCRTSESPTPSKFTRDGRSTHIVQIPDTGIGAHHQLLAWVDLDADGVFDAGEPYDIFPTNFTSREVGDSGLYDYRYPEDFEVQLLRGSTTVGRAGQQSVLRLRLVAPTGRVIGHDAGQPQHARAPVMDAPVGARVFTGPSSTQTMVCFNTDTAAADPASGSCVTDDNGEFVVRYTVEAVPFFAMQQDELVVFHDRDRDGHHDITQPNDPAPEASRRIPLPIAKAVNYIALGDSYSSGEAGANPPAGRYITHRVGDRRDGGLECHRWDHAYPVVFQQDTLGNDALDIDVTFATVACTGAISHNIYHPGDRHGTSTADVYAHTNRPSDKAPATVPTLNETTNMIELVPEPGWEPRQAAQLATRQNLLELQNENVDMITLTIGGNDAGFSQVLDSCVNIDSELKEGDLATTCTAEDLALGFQHVQTRITYVLEYIKRTAPQAAIFVLGYPYVTPLLGTCADTPRDTIDTYLELGPRRSAEQGISLSPQCAAAVIEFAELINACESLSARDIYNATAWYAGIAGFVWSKRVVVDAGEAVFLRAMADDLNNAVLEAAKAAEVHYVDVVGGVNLTDSALSFVGHSPCSAHDGWLNGFEVDRANDPAVSDSTFHPNAAGQRAYAEILDQYILDAIADGADLNDAGLPVNAPPRRQPFTGRGGSTTSSTGTRSTPQAGTGSGSGTVAKAAPGSGGARQAPDSDDGDGPTPARSAGFLIRQDSADTAGCGAVFVSPGEQVTLTSSGFAPSAEVNFAAGAVSLGDTELSAPTIADVTADSNGTARLDWTVPAAPSAQADAAPRAYAMSATGAAAGGGTFTAYMIEPLVAYPDAAPCAGDDTAAAALGHSVQIPVLANDAAPTAGSLDAASVRVLPAAGGTFEVDTATGAVTFTPDAGFSGTVRTSYLVFDGWGIGVRADITVTVAAGCTVTGTAGVVEIVGTDGDDVICVPDPEDRKAFHVIDAKAGNDTILGGAGVEWIYAGSGTDTIYGRGGGDRIVPGSGVDTVYGGAGFDYIYSPDFADVVHDDPDGSELVVAPAVMVASAGPTARSDWHYVDAAQTATIDVLGNDTDPDEDLDPDTLRITRLPVSGAARITTTPHTGPAVEYVAAGVGGSDSLAYEICDRLNGCATTEVTITVGATGCTIVGTDNADTLYGTAGGDVICGLGGDDVIYGLGGDDIIIAGAGDDTLYGGDDTLIGATDGDDLLWGGSGDDTLHGGNGDDTLYGGAGNDTLHGNRRADNLHGGPGADNLHGGGEDDLIWGGPGDDTLDGHAANDHIYGGAGDDMLRGGNGDDTLWGDDGDDIITGGAGADNLHGGPGTDTLNGNTQNDTLWGGAGDDTLDGRGHNDQLHGGTGDDTLRGGAGNDHIYGGAGNDTLDGGNGTDYLNGGPDTDACTRGDTTAACDTEGRRR